MVGKPGSDNGRKLAIKDIVVIVTALSLVAGIFGSIHSEVTIPKILHKTNELIQKAIDRHAEMPHAVSVSKDAYQRDIDRLFQRLDRQEVLLQKLVAGN